MNTTIPPRDEKRKSEYYERLRAELASKQRLLERAAELLRPTTIEELDKGLDQGFHEWIKKKEQWLRDAGREK